MVKRKTYLVFTVDSVTSANASSDRAARYSSGWRTVAPVSSALSVWTVSSHVTCVATNSTDDISSKVALFRAVIFAMADLTTYKIISRVCVMMMEGHLQF